MGCRSDFHEEATIPAYYFPAKHKDFKSKRIRFVKDQQTILTLFVIFITYANLKKTFLKSDEKVKKAPFTNSLKPLPSIYSNNIQSSALPKIPLTRVSPMKINIPILLRMAQ